MKQIDIGKMSENEKCQSKRISLRRLIKTNHKYSFENTDEFSDCLD